MRALKTMGQRLHWAREAAGVSARELDRLAGKTPGHVGLIEARDSDATGKTLAAYAAVLGLSLDWLIVGDKDRAPRVEDMTVAVARARERAAAA